VSVSIRAELVFLPFPCVSPLESRMFYIISKGKAQMSHKYGSIVGEEDVRLGGMYTYVYILIIIGLVVTKIKHKTFLTAKTHSKVQRDCKEKVGSTKGKEENEASFIYKNRRTTYIYYNAYFLCVTIFCVKCKWNIYLISEEISFAGAIS